MDIEQAGIVFDDKAALRCAARGGRIDAKPWRV